VSTHRQLQMQKMGPTLKEERQETKIKKKKTNIIDIIVQPQRRWRENALTLGERIGREKRRARQCFPWQLPEHSAPQNFFTIMNQQAKVIMPEITIVFFFFYRSFSHHSHVSLARERNRVSLCFSPFYNFGVLKLKHNQTKFHQGNLSTTNNIIWKQIQMKTERVWKISEGTIKREDMNGENMLSVKEKKKKRWTVYTTIINRDE